VIRDIASVIRQGENVGIFPSGSRSWAGIGLAFDISIVKLIRLLQVPVLVAVLKGMTLFNPRWSTKLRKTKVEAEYKLLFTKDQINRYTDNELFEQLKKSMFHNEVEYQRVHMNKIRSKSQAEYVNHALYVCPECHAIDSFRAKGNDFKCIECNYDIHINEYGFYERISKGNLHFNNIVDWYKWEEQWMIDFINKKLEKAYEGYIFCDTNSSIYHNKSGAGLDFIGAADVKLFIDRIEIAFNSNKETIILNYNDLQTINPQVNEMLEIFYKGEAFRVIGGREGVSALKWEVAVNVIWKKMGMDNKLSAYIGNWE
jgi:1-acyl-sn-glycerol-3-phosphate acyltransferase